MDDNSNRPREAPSEYGEGGPYDNHEGRGVVGWLVMTMIVFVAVIVIVIATNLNP